ncbi:MAG: prenyltransferase [Ignavibacteria bacterium]|nr:prenyltransferase [Ignavibacteria bacterium]
MVNIAMWGKALRIIPKVTLAEWKQLDIVSRWLISARGAVFVMTAMSALYGGLLALKDGKFNLLPFLLSFFGLIFAHATNNLVNDWTDSKKGVDKDNYYRNLYGPQALEHGLMTEKEMWGYILGSFAIALSCGIYLALTTPTTTIYLILAGIFFIAFYTWPLKYIGLGEVTVLIVWGPLMVGGTYFVVTGGTWSWEVIFVSLVYSIGPTTVLLGKHTDKMKVDKEKRINTLPVIIGETASRFLVIILWIIQYLLIAYLITINYFTPIMALSLAAVPKLIPSIKVFSKPRPTEAPKGYETAWPLYLVYFAFMYNRRFGTIFLLALIIELVFKYSGLLNLG